MPRMRPAVTEQSQNIVRVPEDGAIAQLGERLHGMQEVGGSIPPGSTKLIFNGVTHTVESEVKLPLH